MPLLWDMQSTSWFLVLTKKNRSLHVSNVVDVSDAWVGKVELKFIREDVGITTPNPWVQYDATDAPSWILQVSPSRMRGSEFSTAFQMIEISVLFQLVCLSQFIRLRGAMYLEVATLVQRLLVEISCHPNLAAREDEKSSNFFYSPASPFLR